ncbi:MAG: 50S ribosomal protein L9 [Phycisphaerae bacterium]|nr:50S ribosomal protein L9 [Phycisphaerae bacterium]
MKVLLVEDIEKLGWLGDIVEVKSGYARNYLLPHGLAMVPSEGNIRSIAKEKEKHAQERLEDRKRMERAAEAVAGAEAVISSKANESGHLFGSVTESDIAENLRKQGFEVANSVVKLKHHIKEVGTSEVTLRFAEELTVIVSVVVVAEQAEESEAVEEE